MIARKARRQLEDRGLFCFGVAFHYTDEVMRHMDWLDHIDQELEEIVELGIASSALGS